MGMYDYINGEQVKIFFLPIYDEFTKDTWHSGGSLVDYSNGDSVTTKTLFYKRPKNFIILDENEYEQNPILHIIKESKVHSTISLKDADDSHFFGNEAVLTYYGREINLKTKEDCFNYIKDREISENKYKEITKEHSDVYNKRYIPSYWILSHINPSETIDKFRPDRSSKMDVIFNGINHINEIKKTLEESFDSYEELPKLLKNNDALWDKFCNIVYPIASEIHKSSGDMLDLINEKNRPLLETLEKEFQDKYLFENSYEKEKQLGEYLECLRYMYDDRKEERVIKNLPSNQERYDSLISVIKEFITKNEGVVNNYIEWLELSETQSENIEEIFNCILEDNDNIPVNYLDEILNSL